MAIGGANGTRVGRRFINYRASAFTAVQGILVLGHQVHTLNDVNFAIVRPIVAVRPERRPMTTTSSGHVLDISHKYTPIVLSSTLQTNGRSTSGCVVNFRGVIRTKNYRVPSG